MQDVRTAFLSSAAGESSYPPKRDLDHRRCARGVCKWLGADEINGREPPRKHAGDADWVGMWELTEATKSAYVASVAPPYIRANTDLPLACAPPTPQCRLPRAVGDSHSCSLLDRCNKEIEATKATTATTTRTRKTQTHGLRAAGRKGRLSRVHVRRVGDASRE